MASETYVVYLRVSTEQQGRSGLGLDAQRKAIGDYLNGGSWKVLREYVEVESGKKDDRPELRKAISLSKATGSKLLIAKLDRLSRNAVFLLSLRDSGVDFVCADMPQANRLTVGILALVAQDERERISARTKAALDAAKSRGVRMGNPNGGRALRRDGRHVEGSHRAAKVRQEKAKARAEALRPFVEEAASKVQSLSGIAKTLNAQGIQAPKGGSWSAAQVARVLDRLNMEVGHVAA